MPTIDPAIAWTVSAALAAVFGASAIFKLIDLGEFRAAVENYRILAESFEGAAAIAIPLAEIAGAAGLLIPRTHLASAVLLTLMLALFTTAIVVNLVRGRLYIDCGCFGPALRQPLSWWLPARNIALTGLIAVAALPAGGRILTALDLATVFLGAATIIVLYAGANYLLANAPLLSAFEAADA
jgi:uncharacterized membrane protein